MQALATLLALLFAAPPAFGIVSAYGQPENSSDPATCGSTACPTHHAALATFGFWDRLFRGVGDSAGPFGDGTYVYFGTANGFGYAWTSNHTGSTDAASSYTFVNGANAGDLYRATGTALSQPVDLGNLIQLEPAQWAPGCDAASDPVACCDGYRLGDGTCSGDPACTGGCEISTLPNLDPLPLVHPGELVPDTTLVLVMGYQGAAPSDEREWYLECNSDTERGGLGGTPHACCSVGGNRVEFDQEVAGFVAYKTPLLAAISGLPGTEGSAVIGGAGHDCDDPTPGYTYLGPLDRSAGEGSQAHWALSLYSHLLPILGSGGGGMGALQIDPDPIFDSDSVTTRCWWGYDPNASSSDDLADHLDDAYPPHPRDGTRADCIGAPARPGDSGAPVFAYHGGAWRFVGPTTGKFGAGELLSVTRWSWWEFILGTPLGRSGW